ncbi:MAG: hypothetical protein A3F69_04080 [Acidobacteria bacterium RIFCSPLOWO2_12_FULL_66_10]|nr:MAG: hypothetical protein A3F69_04080 [Acidobacteria bacterium RIFCSPLOWO2_12_FULL_66_10]
MLDEGGVPLSVVAKLLPNRHTEGTFAPFALTPHSNAWIPEPSDKAGRRTNRTRSNRLPSV